MSFFTTVVPVIMRQENYSLESIGLLQLVKLPWILKFLWAPLIDEKANSLNQYKKWIISSEIFYAMIILSIGFFDLEANFYLIVLLIILSITASATQDIATDALAILSLRKDQHSTGNAVQSVGGFLGALVGSGVLLLIYNHFGWKAMLIGLSAFVLIALLPLRFFNYPLKEKPKNHKISRKDIFLFFKRPGSIKHIGFLLLSYSGLSGLMAMLKPYMVDHGYTLAEIGYISGILGTATAAIMAFISGIIIKKTGTRKSLLLFCILGIFAGSYFLIINEYGFSRLQIVIGVCLVWGIYGMMNVVVYILSMRNARLGFEGTDFTLQIVIAQLGSLIIAGMSGTIAQKFTYQGLFIAEITLALVTVSYVLSVYRNKIEE